MDDDPAIEALIRRLAATDLTVQIASDAGQIAPAEVKAYEAHREELVATLDEIRGTSDVTYAQFRTALDLRAGCATLFELRNAMHPKDPLKADATSDLRGVGCLTPRSSGTGG
jgi:hypothetical protein